MKRSKTLLVSNIMATLYVVYLIWHFGGAIIIAGGVDFIYVLKGYFEMAFEILGMNSPGLTFLYVILILLCIHIVAFALGCLIGWVAFATKKSGIAKLAATLYLIGTICFPLYLFLGIVITIVGFIGGGKQKIINNMASI